VRRDERGKGIGRQLAWHALGFAGRHYTHVALRCDTDAADRFYCVLGFTRVGSNPNITHLIELKGLPNQSPEPTARPVTSPAGQEPRQP
jgi:GNAT superfamily N-acetyltransferase